jgi:hypothetical protein
METPSPEAEGEKGEIKHEGSEGRTSSATMSQVQGNTPLCMLEISKKLTLLCPRQSRRLTSVLCLVLANPHRRSIPDLQ